MIGCETLARPGPFAEGADSGGTVSRRLLLFGLGILGVWGTCALFGGLFGQVNPLSQDLLLVNRPPSAAHPFGTDSLGRDVLARVIVGSRQTLLVAFSATALGIALGTLLGLVEGYYRGVIDIVLSRLTEAFLALPLVILTFLFVVAVGPSTLTVVLVVGIAFGLVCSRTIRAAVLQERDLDYVSAARLRGDGAGYILFAEILPNVSGVIAVEATVRLAYSIFAVATLSFLGFGVRPPAPDWGADIAVNYQYLAAGFWWETLFPALAIASLTIAVNLVGDYLETRLL